MIDLTKHDQVIVNKCWMRLIEPIRSDGSALMIKTLANRFISDYRNDGRLWEPKYRHGEARAVITCQVRGMW